MGRNQLWRRWLGTGGTSGREQAQRRSRRRPAALGVEPLEDRVVPANFAPTIFTDSAALDSGSLRAAVLQANASADDQNTITLQAGTYDLSVTGAGEDVGGTGDLDLTASGPSRVRARTRPSLTPASSGTAFSISSTRACR